MPATDNMAPQYLDLRHYSSDWRMTCPIHGNVYIVKQYNGDWARTYCADCVEAEDAKTSRKVALDPNGGPPFPIKS